MRIASIIQLLSLTIESLALRLQTIALFLRFPVKCFAFVV
jgi:hypothetical protein